MHKKHPPTEPKTLGSEPHGDNTDGGVSRRAFLQSTTAGLVAGAVAGAELAGTALAEDFRAPGQRQDASPRRRILLQGGVVLTMDPTIGDFEKADVLIEGSKIAAVGPNIQAAAQVIDVTGMIIMPGFIDTHHHQYETIQRSIIPDGILAILLAPTGRRKTMSRSCRTSGQRAGFQDRRRPIRPSGTWDVLRTTRRIVTSRSL